MAHKVFWSEPGKTARESLRRYRSSAMEKCAGKYGYHNAETLIGDREASDDECRRDSRKSAFDKTDPRWPTKCDYCDYVFKEDDEWQHNVIRLYEGGGHKFPLQEAPVGAMWDATWYPAGFGKGEDGISLIVQTPGGTWHVDSRASNCDMPDDKEHRCWVRHGDPRTGKIHVDKNGKTCHAGAGSIICGTYHGFLHNGELT